MNKFEALLFDAVANKLNVKKLSAEDQQYTQKTYNAMNKTNYKNYTLDQILYALSTVISKKILDNRNTNINLHDYQAKHLIDDGDNESYNKSIVYDQTSITSFLGIESIDELKLLVNPESMYVQYYVVLDSDYRNTTQENSTNITYFTWAYSPTQNTGVGFCNSVGNVHNIVGMRMYQPRVPYLSAMNTSAKRVSILVKELQAQAFITETGSRFHFLLRPDYTTANSSIELSTEDYNDGIFSFGKPITEFPSQTIIFGDPINTLSFSTPFDRFIIAIEYTCIKDQIPDY
jgi:hypothetical protein